jgi:uncharacterized membrane protein (DUF373 family)
VWSALIWALEHTQDLVSVIVGVLLAVGLVAVIRKILFVLSSEESVSTAELALLIAMIAVFVAALILVSRYDRTDAGR